jgi:pimeloyl-ACP methyl ester carboxylesterase
MTMRTIADDAGASLQYTEHGEGTLVLVLHGAYSTHLEIVAAIEPIFATHTAYRRVYPDLTGMGDSPAHESIQTTNDLVDLLEHLVEDVVGDAPLLVIGHSYGGHLARSIAARRPRQVVGMALICPMMPAAMHPEMHVIVRAEADAIGLVDPALRDDFTGYFVVQTVATAERFNAAVAPSIGRFDADAVGRVMEEWRVEHDPFNVAFDNPILIVTGRHDSFTGYRGPMALIDLFPRATFAVVADAGHALPHERPGLLAALVTDWLATV